MREDWPRFVKIAKDRENIREYLSWKPVILDRIRSPKELHRWLKKGMFDKNVSKDVTFQERQLHVDAQRFKDKIHVHIKTIRDKYAREKNGTVIQYIFKDTNPKFLFSIHDAVRQALYQWQTDYYKKGPASE